MQLADPLEPLVDMLTERVSQNINSQGAYSIQHAAEYLDCSRKHVENLIERGELTPANIAIGEQKKMDRVTRVELDRYLELKRRAA